MNGDYNVAVHALVLLAHRGVLLSSDELAGNICTHSARVRKIMAPLNSAGIIEAHEGRDGGYQLRLPAQKITLADVAKALGVRFVYCTWSSGDLDMDCVVASGMAGVMDAVYDDLDAICRKQLEKRTIADLEHEVAGTI